MSGRADRLDVLRLSLPSEATAEGMVSALLRLHINGALQVMTLAQLERAAVAVAQVLAGPA